MVATIGGAGIAVVTSVKSINTIALSVARVACASIQIVAVAASVSAIAGRASVGCACIAIIAILRSELASTHGITRNNWEARICRRANRGSIRANTVRAGKSHACIANTTLGCFNALILNLIATGDHADIRCIACTFHLDAAAGVGRILNSIDASSYWRLS